MRDDSAIESRIAEVLAGSRVPVERRAAVAEELRGHLEQLVETKRAGGLDDESAVEAALDDFGPPEAIRQRLRRQQGSQDHREALTAACRFLPSLIAVAAALAVGIAVASSGILLWRIVATVAVFTSLFLAMCPVVYVVSLARLRTRQQLPRRECRFIANASYWFVLAIVCMGISEIILAAGALMTFASLQAGMPHAVYQLDFGQLSPEFGTDMAPDAGSVMAFFSCVAGLILAGRQRWRCAEDTTKLAA